MKTSSPPRPRTGSVPAPQRPLTPVEEAILKESDTILDLRSRNKLLSTIIIGMIVLLFFSLIGMFVLGSMPSHIPMMVTVHDDGSAKFIGMPDFESSQGNFRVSEESVRFFMREFYLNVFSLPTDRKLYFDRLNQYFAFLAEGKSAGAVDAELRRLRVEYDAGDVRYECSIVSQVRVKDNVWQVDYRRTEFNKDGIEVESKVYRSFVTVVLALPTAATVRYNPLGILFDSFETLELEQ